MTRPVVGIFDSGVGGLSVAREIHRVLPQEDLLYFADTAYCPYGDRAVDEIRARSLAIGQYLQEAGAKVLVVACNTASGAALEALREELSIPVIGLEPAVKPAVSATRNGRVGVMATAGTLRSARFGRLLHNHASSVQVIVQPCPGLADLVEEGMLEGEVLGARLADFVAPLKAGEVDTVVLGCTHYVFVRDAIAEALGPDVRLLDSGTAIARRTAEVLRDADQLAEAPTGFIELRTTGGVAEVAPIASRLWGAPLPTVQVAV